MKEANIKNLESITADKKTVNQSMPMVLPDTGTNPLRLPQRA